MRKEIIMLLAGLALLLIGCGETTANISGEAFLKTNGGSVITCAGNPVYIEKADENGYMYLTDLLEPKKIILSGIESRLHTSDKSLKYWIKEQQYYIEFYQSHVKENPKEALHKRNIKEAKIDLDNVKKELLLIQNQVESLELQREKSLKENTKKTVCTSQGHFNFYELHPENYYVRTTVQWYAGDEKQGGILSKVVTIKEGKNKIILTE